MLKMDLARERDPDLSKKYLGGNLTMAVILVVIVFIISQAWSDVYRLGVMDLFGRELTFAEEVILSLTITIIFILVLRYILRINLLSFT